MERSKTDIEQLALDFLNKYNPNQQIPVPIEEIIELQLGLNIIPIKDLYREYQVDGFLSHDCKTIFIDENNYMRQSNRARFTLAHEVGHTVLHRHVIANIKNMEEWHTHILGAGTGKAIYEAEANIFAGYVLVPTNKLQPLCLTAQQMVVNEFKAIKKPIPPMDKLIPFISTFIAKQFEVSERVVEIRLQNLVGSKEFAI